MPRKLRSNYTSKGRSRAKSENRSIIKGARRARALGEFDWGKTW